MKKRAIFLFLIGIIITGLASAVWYINLSDTNEEQDLSLQFLGEEEVNYVDAKDKDIEVINQEQTPEQNEENINKQTTINKPVDIEFIVTSLDNSSEAKIDIYAITTKKIEAFQLAFKYDPEKIEVKGLDSENLNNATLCIGPNISKSTKEFDFSCEITENAIKENKTYLSTLKIKLLKEGKTDIILKTDVNANLYSYYIDELGYNAGFKGTKKTFEVTNNNK